MADGRFRHSEMRGDGALLDALSSEDVFQTGHSVTLGARKFWVKHDMFREAQDLGCLSSIHAKRLSLLRHAG